MVSSFKPGYSEFLNSWYYAGTPRRVMFQCLRTDAFTGDNLKTPSIKVLRKYASDASMSGRKESLTAVVSLPIFLAHARDMHHPQSHHSVIWLQ